MRLLLHSLALILVATCVTVAHAQAYDATDTLTAITEASRATGVSQAVLYRVVDCETGGTLSPDAIGDHGTSFGAAQLHRGGLLGTFYTIGYNDPFDPYQSLDFMARQFAAGNASKWTCA